MNVEEFRETFPTTIRLVGVKVRDRGEVKEMGAGDATLRVGDHVMLELAGDLTYGVVYTGPQTMPFLPTMRVMKSVLLEATPEGSAAIARHERIAREGMAYCRDLARRFGGRIEMRQVGAREEARRLGRVDTCGWVLCCASFLTKLQPVSVKRARSHGTEIGKSCLIGVCGRLKCCLMFEAHRPQAVGPFPPVLINPTRSS